MIVHLIIIVIIYIDDYPYIYYVQFPNVLDGTSELRATSGTVPPNPGGGRYLLYLRATSAWLKHVCVGRLLLHTKRNFAKIRDTQRE